jgi:hypothetical protein
MFIYHYVAVGSPIKLYPYENWEGGGGGARGCDLIVV